MLKFLKDWTLPISIVLGGVAYLLYAYIPWLQPTRAAVVHVVDITMPIFIFTMLFLSFSAVDLRQLRWHRWYVWVVLFQFVFSIGGYLVVAPFDRIVAQGVIVCFLAPTATSAAIITQKLGGSASSIISYTILINLLTTVSASALLPLIEPHPNLTFFPAFLLLLAKIFPLLILPFISAFVLQLLFKWWRAWVERSCGDLAFYLWAMAVTVLIARTISAVARSNASAAMVFALFFASLVTCLSQFWAGKKIGGVYGERISAGQALGQKNTTLAIWMAYTFLNPLSSVAPGAYVLWQNSLNSWQLWRHRKREAKQGKK